jgi:hypothetical protein
MIADFESTDSMNDDEEVAAVNEAESLLKQSADEKAAMVGLQSGEVQTARYDAHDLFRNGLAVKLHTNCPTFETKVDPEMFGFTFSSQAEREAWQRNVKLGNIGTLPKKQRSKIANIKSRRDTHYNRYANESSFVWGDVIKMGDADPERGREEGWVFVEWLNGEIKLCKEFEVEREYVHEHWDELMEEMRAEYREIGVGLYARLKDADDLARARAEKRGEPAPESNLGTLEGVVNGFVSRLTARIAGKREEVYAGMSMSREIRDIPLTSEMAQDQAKAEQILLDKAKMESELSTLEMIKVEKIRTAREEAREGAKTLMDDLRAAANGRLGKMATNVLKAIQENGEIPGGSVRGIRNLVESIDRLVIIPDDQIDAQIAECRRLLAQECINDDVQDVQSVMKKIAAESKLVLLELDRKVDSTREIGVPDTTVGLRRVLGMEPLAPRETLTISPLPVSTGETRDGLRDF